jgi:hypothetical protein
MDVFRTTSVSAEEATISDGRILGALQLLWMGLTIVCMQLLGVFSFETLYVVSYLSLVFLSQMVSPDRVTDRQWTSIQWSIRLGFLGLCYFVAQRVVDVTQF